MNNPFSPEQQSIIVGSLLGDGNLTKVPYGNSAFTKCQCSARREYLEWHSHIFNKMACPIKEYDNRANGKLYRKATIRIKAHPIFSILRNKWYPHGKKIVPPDLTLDPLAFSIWFFDDGSNNVRNRTITFATYCFSSEDIEILLSQMETQFGIHCRVDNRNSIVAQGENYDITIDVVRPFMLWDCFRYKIEHRPSLTNSVRKNDIPKVINWYQNGKPVSWIATQMGTSKTPIYSILRRSLSTNNLPLSNKSGVKGVCRDKSRNKWVASYKRNGKSINVGRFDTIEAAAIALAAHKANL